MSNGIGRSGLVSNGKGLSGLVSTGLSIEIGLSGLVSTSLSCLVSIETGLSGLVSIGIGLSGLDSNLVSRGTDLSMCSCLSSICRSVCLSVRSGLSVLSINSGGGAGRGRLFDWGVQARRGFSKALGSGGI